MTKRYIAIILLCSAFLAGGCKKYLDVQPEGSYTEKEVYGNEQAVQQTLNGIYLDLAGNAFYGANMSTTIIELLAQHFKPARIAANAKDLSVFYNYSYASQIAQDFFDTTWRKGYSIAQETNVFLANIDNSIRSKAVSEAHGAQLKGEALAIRALVQFDLLRLFGPVYSSGSTSPAIPYYTTADGKLQPISTAAEVVEKVIADLSQSVQLLAQDPVIAAGVTASTDFYTGLRNQRLNYYAVKGLLARAYLWAGKKQEAHDAALSVITEGEKWFPWSTADAVYASPNPDRIFSSEILFALYNPGMYTNYLTYFTPSLSDDVIFAPDSTRLSTAFEANQNDWRFTQTWKREGKPYRTFFKYADMTISTLPWRFLQPMVRKSEMYYILAETDPDATTALGYLNTVRSNRGIAPLSAVAGLPSELRKEYQKEFWGEGQLFFYYKRIDATGVPYAPYPYDWYTIDPEYVVPLPLSETTTR